jgi:hypothetical protein
MALPLRRLLRARGALRPLGPGVLAAALAAVAMVVLLGHRVDTSPLPGSSSYDRSPGVAASRADLPAHHVVVPIVRGVFEQASRPLDGPGPLLVVTVAALAALTAGSVPLRPASRVRRRYAVVDLVRRRGPPPGSTVRASSLWD